MDHTPIRDFIAQEHAAGRVTRLRDIVDRFGISIRTAHTIRSAMVRSGDLPAAAANFRRGGRRAASADTPTDWNKIIQDVIDGKATILTDEQRRGLLSAAILADPTGPAHMAAQNALTRLNAASQTAVSYSPGVPLTDEQRIDRMASLLRSQGLVLVRAALRRAFPQSFERYDAILTD